MSSVINPNQRGPKGDTGATGTQGPKGDTGNTGAQGADGLLSIQRARLTTTSDGTVTWTFPSAFASTPRVWGLVITGAGVTDVFNIQVEGSVTTTQAKFRVNRTQLTVVALLGLTILSVPASVGATQIDVFACPQ